MRALLGARASEKFLEGFAKSASMIILSEIGDKTFFIAALLAVRHARAVVFLGSWSASTVMTALSAVVGAAAPTLINAETTHRAATTLFFVFGVRSLRDAMTSSGDDGDASELDEVEAELAGRRRRSRASAVFAESFAVTFLAEWGDRSQIATVGLAAASDVLGVTLGGSLGHAACTGVAVLGGRRLADRAQNSARVVAAASGVFFTLFGVHAALVGPPS